MINSGTKGDRIEIRGLCSFYVKEYKAYAGRNPKTGKPILLGGTEKRRKGVVYA
ncbi:MAG: HU family DNA-binding protein [Deltaproteobacteria bacterium]|nr:HU family DNA-binding protein [Deltaproteobacteria bacterium]MBW2620592.1 HU family DNA-binding protein [Deltaproteobacteria bacterium]